MKSADGGLSREREKSLILRAQEGDREAMRILVDTHKDRLYAFISRMIRHHHDTEEVCQEAFLRAFTHLDRFSTAFRFSTWLFTIAYRICLNSSRRRRGSHPDVDLTLVSEDHPPVEGEAAEEEERVRVRDLVWREVARLPDPQRGAILLFYRYNQSCQEISKVLDVPVATVKSHLHRARAKLREGLRDSVLEKAGDFRGLSGLSG